MTARQTLSATEAARQIAQGRLSPVDLIEACLDEIARHDGAIAAWIHIDADGARVAARERAAEAKCGKLRGPLHGVPVTIKDNIDVAGLLTTSGAAAFAHRYPTADALCVARLRAAGAIVLGKVATTEFAYFEPAATRNPWNVAHTPGGSSSGPAAAVAARMVPLALGTQTIGSVLRPAAFCGIVGFKGSFDAVPVEGVSALARSFDHVGVFARSVADARLAFAVLSGRAHAQRSVEAPRLAIVPQLLARAEPHVAAEITRAAERLAAAGAKIAEIALPPSFAAIHDAARVIQECEFAADQEKLYRDHAAEYRPRTRELVIAGLARSATAYVRAQQARALFRDEMAPILQSAAFLLTPVAPGLAPKGLGSTGDPWFCAPWTSIGVPAIALPTTIDASGLPHALQLVAPHTSDAALLDAAQWCEEVLAFDAVPALAAPEIAAAPVAR